MGVMLQSDVAGDLLTKTTLSPAFASATNPRDHDGHNLDATCDTIEPPQNAVNEHADGGTCGLSGGRLTTNGGSTVESTSTCRV